MDVRCLCSPPVRPFSNTSSALHRSISGLPSPYPGGQPSLPCQSCSCLRHSAECHRGPSSHHDRNCARPLSEHWDYPTKNQCACPIHRCPPAYAPKSHQDIFSDRCAHVHPWRPTAQVDRSGMPPVVTSWAGFSRDPMREVSDLTEQQPMIGNCAVYSLDTRGLDPLSQHQHHVPCLPMHYAVYSSPVSLSCSPKEGGRRFSNKVPPVLFAVHHKEQGSPSYVEELPQIDRSPTPSILDSYWAFSGD